MAAKSGCRGGVKRERTDVAYRVGRGRCARGIASREGTAMMIAVVGSGGKTTYIREQAKLYREQGKRVLVTTTTHMYAEPDTLFTNDSAEICVCLESKGYCMAGQRAEETDPSASGDSGHICAGRSEQVSGQTEGSRAKIRGLSADVLAQAAQCADIVLVEADGSRGKPVKYPAEHEPVIPVAADVIVIVMGFFAVGQTIEQACHRPELVCACLGVTPAHHLTEQDLQKLVEEGYRKPLARQYPHAKIICRKTL